MTELKSNQESSGGKEKSTTPRPIVFYKLGGTWDMVERNGRMVGTGNLDDGELSRMEDSLGIHSPLDPSTVDAVEMQLCKMVLAKMKNTSAEPLPTEEHLSSWAKNSETEEEFGNFVTGPFTALYSGDSSHLRASLIAPIVTILIEQAIKEPEKPILGAQGTDTADIALMSLIDALVFDTQLPPFIFTGANRSHREEKSDAPQNFLDLAKVAKKDVRVIGTLGHAPKSIAGDIGYTPDTYVSKEDAASYFFGSGAFWLFQGNLHSSANLVKIDPQETRKIEGQSTFFSPHKNVTPVAKILTSSGLDFRPDIFASRAPSSSHIVGKLAAAKADNGVDFLYMALNSVCTIDLGDQNRISEQVQQILDPNNKAIILEAHSLGNVNNIIRAACVDAAKKGKLIIDTSRTLIGDVNVRYAGSLLDANSKEGELKGTGTVILTSHRLNKTAARAIAVRAIAEGLDQEKTQDLIDRYATSRYLS